MIDRNEHHRARMVLVAAVAYGQGKTTVTAALARRFLRMGQRVRVFKAGPDFIDPMRLERASGAAVRTLDRRLAGLELCRRQPDAAAADTDVALIEGVMGHDDGTPSAADLAREFDVRMLAVIDASAMAQAEGAPVLGLPDYGPVELAGVIANRVAGECRARMVADSLREAPRLSSLPGRAHLLPERHLDLAPPAEVEHIDAVLDALARQLQLDGQAWNARPPRLPAQALPEPVVRRCWPGRPRRSCAMRPSASFTRPARALCMRPAHAFAVAHRWQASTCATQDKGVPVLAECGGLIAICEWVVGQHGRTCSMAGPMPGQVRMQERPGGLGSQGLTTVHGLPRGTPSIICAWRRRCCPLARAAEPPSGSEGGRA